MGAGFVFQDYRGQVLMAGAHRFAHIQDPELVEAMVMHYLLVSWPTFQM
jgi:hypothetical protein